MNASSVSQQTDNLNVLVIDDNEGFREILERFLTKQGMRADSADNGLSGLNKYLDNSERFDVILMDLQMPVMDGYEVSEHIHETETGKIPPIIAMSGSSDEPESSRFDFCLQKPFQFDDLMRAIRSVTANRRKEGT